MRRHRALLAPCIVLASGDAALSKGLQSRSPHPFGMRQGPSLPERVGHGLRNGSGEPSAEHAELSLLDGTLAPASRPGNPIAPYAGSIRLASEPDARRNKAGGERSEVGLTRRIDPEENVPSHGISARDVPTPFRPCLSRGADGDPSCRGTAISRLAFHDTPSRRPPGRTDFEGVSGPASEEAERSWKRNGRIQRARHPPSRRCGGTKLNETKHQMTC